MPKHCVAYGCTNHNYMYDKKLSFLIFPDKVKQHERHQKWVQACKRVNADGSKWEPGGKYVYPCSEHFIEGKSNSNPNHPDYIPTIFKYVKENNNSKRKMDRFNSVEKRSKVREEILAARKAISIPEKESVNKDYSAELAPVVKDELMMSPSSVDFNVNIDLTVASTPKRHAPDTVAVTINTTDLNTCEESAISNQANQTEMEFLRVEKINLHRKLKTLEE